MEVKKLDKTQAAEFQAHTRLLRSVAWQGIVSTIILMLSVILLLCAFYVSYLAGGDGGISVGVLGALAIAAAFVSLIFALLGIRKQGRRHGACFIGAVGSIIIIAAMVWICVAL